MEYNDPVINKFKIVGSHPCFIQIDPEEDENRAFVVYPVIPALFIAGGIGDDGSMLIHGSAGHFVNIIAFSLLLMLSDILLSGARQHGIKDGADPVYHRTFMKHGVEIMCLSGIGMIHTVYHHKILIAFQFKVARDQISCVMDIALGVHVVQIRSDPVIERNSGEKLFIVILILVLIKNVPADRVEVFRRIDKLFSFMVS